MDGTQPCTADDADAEHQQDSPRRDGPETLRHRERDERSQDDSEQRNGWTYFALASTVSAAVVIASVAAAIVISGSGAQEGLWSEGSLVTSPLTASHFACGTPPTRK